MPEPAAPPLVVFLDSGAFTVPLAPPRIAAPHRWREHAATAPEDIAERLAGAAVAITNGVALPGEVLRQLPDLRFIAACSAGLDHIDLAVCAAQGIVVKNAAGYATHSVAEHVFALLLALKRNLLPTIADVRAGAWQRSGQGMLADYPISDLHGSRLGLVGGGAIGQAVGRIAEGFGMTVLLAARKGAEEIPPGRHAFDEVLAESDVISLHCPLTPETRGLIGAGEFARMARRPILINTARGELVEEAALAAALAAGQIAAAASDVASQEPPAPDNPLLALTEDPRFLLTPHQAWASREAQQALFDQAIGQVAAFLADHSDDAG